MSKTIGKSKIPLQFKVFHTLIGLATFFSLITVPAESQMISIFNIQVSSEILWWPAVFFIFYLINSIYGFEYLRHAIYLIMLFRIFYIFFLKIAIFLPSSTFWNMQDIYSQTLGRDFLYILKSSFFIWFCGLIPQKIFLETKRNSNFDSLITPFSLAIFILFEARFLTNYGTTIIFFSTIFALFLYLIFNFFAKKIIRYISINEKITNSSLDLSLFNFKIKYQANNDTYFKFHHILFCLNIVFFIASKTMASKFITFGFFTINVGGIVFSLAYLTSDIMTDVYGIERTKQMILFVIFTNLIFVFDIWITNFLAYDKNHFKNILTNQTRMFLSSGIAYFLGMTINSTVISIIKSLQRKKGISLKKEFITTVWTRVATSSAFGIIIDVSLFSFVAFYGIVPNEKLPNIILFEDLYKISYEILLAPLSVLTIYFLKIKEKVDIYDELSNLNPFRINTKYKFDANKFYENRINQ